MVIGVFHEARVDFHLAAEHRFERLRHVVPSRYFFVARGELCIRWDDAEFLLSADGFRAQLVPTLVKLALIFISPLLRHMMRRMGGTGREVDKEWFVRCERLLLRNPGHRLVGHVLHEVVAFFRRLLWLDRGGAFVQRRVPLICLTADKAIKILEAAAAGGPCVEWTHRACFPHRNLVAFAKLRGGVAVEFQRPRQRRYGIRQHRAVPRCSGGDLRNATHACGVMVSPG